jgi:hypothetical protein
MKVAGVASKWKRNVAATQVLNPLLSVALSRLSTLFAPIDQAQPLTRDRALVEASALMAQGLAEQLAAVLAVIARFEQTGKALYPAPRPRPV